VSPKRVQIVDDVPLVRDASIVSRHHRLRNPARDDGEHRGVARAVIPVLAGEVRRLLAALLLDDRGRDASLDRALIQSALST